ncbi:hypothetical protein RA307_13105 [Xanthobacteraceae bacterium Astr-EGSB]|uniref:hypothetical protein n=1 Tax=Astrobacterium formosum TaxID=3069710 RepID=UPI0027B76723|nr:hypothetical protein [Xanthobacteraceae bacterium Astr-EGSB]
MPILFLVLIALLVAQIGFWDSLAAMLGAVGVVILLVLILAALVGAGAYYVVRRAGSRL